MMQLQQIRLPGTEERELAVITILSPFFTIFCEKQIFDLSYHLVCASGRGSISAHAPVEGHSLQDGCFRCKGDYRTSGPEFRDEPCCKARARTGDNKPCFYIFCCLAGSIGHCLRKEAVGAESILRTANYADPANLNEEDWQVNFFQCIRLSYSSSQGLHRIFSRSCFSREHKASVPSITAFATSRPLPCRRLCPVIDSSICVAVITSFPCCLQARSASFVSPGSLRRQFNAEVALAIMMPSPYRVSLLYCPMPRAFQFSR